MKKDFPTTYRKATAVTKSDTNDSGNVFQGLYIGEGGDLVVVPAEGVSQTVTFQNMPSGTVLAMAVNRVYSTGNTCSAIVGLS